MSNTLFPIFVKLDQVYTLLVGGGKVGLEKTNALLVNDPTARLSVVAKEVCEDLRMLLRAHPQVVLEERPFRIEDLDGKQLVICATGDPALNETIRAATRARGILLNIADTPDLCDFYLSSVVRKGNLKIAISTNGKSPTMAKRLRELFSEIFPDETEELRQILPHWRGDAGTRAAGLYVHAHEQDRLTEDSERGMVVAIRSTMLKDPMSLVATVAHELGHVILLGGKLLSPKTTDHEPMTDLLTVFLGLGLFTANSAARFKQFQEDRRIGWSMQSLGYLPESVFGYALARFATERGENKPEWARHLSPNVRSDFKRSKRWLTENPQYVTMATPIG